MFPHSFNARVPERMAVWGALLGFLAFLYGATEIIQLWKTADILRARQQAAGALTAHVEAEAALARMVATSPVERGQSAFNTDVKAIETSLAKTGETLAGEDARKLVDAARGQFDAFQRTLATWQEQTLPDMLVALMQARASLGKALEELMSGIAAREAAAAAGSSIKANLSVNS